MNFISSTLRCAISCPLLNHLREGQWDARRSLLLFPKAYSVPHLFNFSFLWKLNSLLWMWCRAVWHVCTQTPCRKPCKESVACLPAQGRAGSCSAPQAHTSWTLPAGLWRWGLQFAWAIRTRALLLSLQSCREWWALRELAEMVQKVLVCWKAKSSFPLCWKVIVVKTFYIPILHSLFFKYTYILCVC